MNTLQKTNWEVASRLMLATALLGLLLPLVAAAAEYKPGIQWDEPKIIDPGPPCGAPADAVVLFDGKDMSAWQNGEKWIIKDGCVTSASGSIQTKQPFGDVQLHVEWATPLEVTGSGQGRGNSGVLFMGGRYEVQILDSYQNTTYFDGQAAAIYKQHPPLVNACRKPGEWQTYDIVFLAPKFDEQGGLVEPAYVTVFQNGVLVQNHFKLEGDTPFNRPPKYTAHPAKLPLELQFHHNPLQFRNVWAREIEEIKGKRVAEPMVEEAPAKPAASKESANPATDRKATGRKKGKRAAAK